jgi:hypothetical protein
MQQHSSAVLPPCSVAEVLVWSMHAVPACGTHTYMPVKQLQQLVCLPFTQVAA